MEKELDLRVQKTYNALLKALYDLLCEKSFDEITVTEICKKAMTRNATFYKHFGDKTELFTFMVKEMQRESREKRMVTYDRENPINYYIDVFRYFLDFLDEHDIFVTRIVNSSAFPTLMDLLSEQVENDFRFQMEEDQKNGFLPSVNPNMLSVTCTGGMVYLGRWWIENGKPVEKEEILDQFHHLLTNL